MQLLSYYWLFSFLWFISLNSGIFYGILCRHGIFQFLTAWSDGPEYVTQCPITPGGSYTYQFNITGQEGTLWWHGHSSFLRATVHGALIIRPRQGNSYPFSFDEEVPILLGTIFLFFPIISLYLNKVILKLKFVI